MTFLYTVRVYFEDTDAAGVVYHSNYLKFMERARSEWLIAHHIGVKSMINEHQLVFAVCHTETNYLRSAKLEELLEVSVKLIELKRASAVFQQVICRNNEVICEGITRVACLTTNALRPRPIPTAIHAQLQLLMS
jgi:acyl-CoA thioester hydrolase